jgi:hypothetical protein
LDEESLMALEVTVPVEITTFENKLKNLLSNKDKLVGKESKDGRNQYQIQIQKLKDQMKAYKKGGGEGYVSFGKLLKDVKKQEREGKFDRGAEGETKKKLRAKMSKGAQTAFTSGVHKGSDRSKQIEKSGIKDMTSKGKARISRILTDTEKEKEEIASRGKR